jgi:cobyrinic acid a,c-diamide synthase
MAEAVAATINLERVRALAGPLRQPPSVPRRQKSDNGLRLGLSWDEAFRFAYGPVIDRLEANGVEVVRFSPLRDAAVPAGLDGLWLCGGYPESHARILAANRDMRESVAGFCATGKPVLAECGGLLYLATDIVDPDGETHTMCGVVPAKGSVGKKLQQLGYRTACANEDLFVASRGSLLRGHEFHYGSLEGSWQGAWRPAFELAGSRGTSGPEGWWNGSVLATWFHGWLAAGDSVDRWIEAMRAARTRSAT